MLQENIILNKSEPREGRNGVRLREMKMIKLLIGAAIAGAVFMFAVVPYILGSEKR